MSLLLLRVKMFPCPLCVCIYQLNGIIWHFDEEMFMSWTQKPTGGLVITQIRVDSIKV